MALSGPPSHLVGKILSSGRREANGLGRHLEPGLWLRSQGLPSPTQPRWPPTCSLCCRSQVTAVLEHRALEGGGHLRRAKLSEDETETELLPLTLEGWLESQLLCF